MKLLATALVGSVLAHSGTELPQNPVFVTAAFARLQPSTPELGERFAWPETARFETVHRQVAGAAPIRLIGGRVTATRADETHETTVVVALDARPGGGVLEVYAENESGGYQAARGPVRTAPVQLWLAPADKPHPYVIDGMTVKFVPSAAGPAPAVEPAAWTDWTYATTLMALQQPVYATPPPDDERWGPKQAARSQSASRHLDRIEIAIKHGKSQAALAAIAAALATPVADTGVWGEHGWDKVAKWAEEQQALDAAIAIRARLRLVGRCSMDSAPQQAATTYADLCYAAGRLGCFLNLQVQIMGDQFERVAYSSYGDAAHQTHAERLRNIGIDSARFLRGLVFRFAVPGNDRRELAPWRLARSMKEAGLSAEMAAFLRGAATKTELDTFNRMRAAETYAYLRFHNELPAGRLADDDKARRELLAKIRADLVGLQMPEPAASWARGFGKSD